MVRARRRELDRPLALAIAIEPHGLHAGLPGADHVGERIVSDVQHLGGAHARHAGSSAAKMRASGLAAPAAIAGDVAVEQIADAAAVQIGIAVAQREQAIAAAQPLERRPHVGVELDAIAGVRGTLRAPRSLRALSG